jgi:hypothetical protein
MQLGLRHRLRNRPSLLDLVSKKDIEEPSAASPNILIERDSATPAVPLPTSPELAQQSSIPAPNTPVQPQVEAKRGDLKMVPVCCGLSIESLKMLENLPLYAEGFEETSRGGGRGTIW